MVAAAPRLTKTVENPRTNTQLMIATRRTRPAGASVALNSATFTPLMNER